MSRESLSLVAVCLLLQEKPTSAKNCESATDSDKQEGLWRKGARFCARKYDPDRSGFKYVGGVDFVVQIHKRSTSESADLVPCGTGQYLCGQGAGMVSNYLLTRQNSRNATLRQSRLTSIGAPQFFERFHHRALFQTH